MEKYLVVLGFLGLLYGISAEISCKNRKWNILDNHYVPWEMCSFNKSDYQEKAQLRTKYLKVLSARQLRPNWKEIENILDTILKLHPTESHFIESKAVLSKYICKGGSNIVNYLMQAGRKEKFILNFLRRVFSDLFDKNGYVINRSLFGVNFTANNLSLTNFVGPNFEYICNAILNVYTDSLKDPFSPKEDLNLTSGAKPGIAKPVPPDEKAPKLKVIHISDIHLDKKYVVGSWADCDKPVCCRKNNVPPNDKAEKAGKFGAWKCDTPLITFTSLLNHIKQKHSDVAYILWTGDSISHEFEKRDTAFDMSTIAKTAKTIKKILPFVTVYPTMGHFSPLKLPWFYDKNRIFHFLSIQWGRWLSEDITKLIKSSGHYTTLIRPGFRLVSLNTNFCSKIKRMFLTKNNDLKWLASTLKQAEKNNEKVHIIGHIPPNSPECAVSWTTDYYNIINRYEGTVTAQFFGHTHGDEFEVFYDTTNTSRPTGVAFVAPSVNPYGFRNPSYKVYYVEGDYKNSQRYVLDHESWYLDLEKANKQNNPEWKKLYSAKQEYRLKSLYPEDLHNFYKTLKKNEDDSAENYFKNYWSNSPKRPKFSPTDSEILCRIRSCNLFGEVTFDGHKHTDVDGGV